MQRTTPTSSSTPVFPGAPFSVALFTNPGSFSRPSTRDGSVEPLHHPPQSPPPPIPTSAPVKESRKASFSRKASLSGTARRRGSSVGSAAASNPNAVVTDAAAPPALPEYALPAAAKLQNRDKRDVGGVDDSVRSPVSPSGAAGGLASMSRTNTAAGGGYFPPPMSAGATASLNNTATGTWQQSEASMIHEQMTDVAAKRISTLEYLRKAHEGRVYWFNTYLFERPDLSRMQCLDPRKLARKAANYLLLGLSIPTVIDLYSSTPIEFLRCLNSLLSEFDSFQQLHGDSSAAHARARLPTMFRRPGGKSRRSGSAADMHLDDSHAFPHPSGAGAGNTTPSVMNFAVSESDLFPGEEYTYLLTPALPFEPDFVETFATLCDVLIDCYSRLLALVPTPKECSAPVAELFAKVDSKLRKIIVQGVVKEFEDHSRAHVKTEVASIGKVVLGGLM
ncbi:uncharacterized protein MAM_07269 [Metarhizium album ARSEF 1941]|uniref:Uncharacterized protein n=1 Tax=Metarhizium album (strain ARSEF 1941) TaxID=1081103 RepID=A0A0B2WPD4_METAS|nr:uncharacterized protein MAM_07269 [Metarhizium album ARSEF 1941]KHN94850.1 hypothetical protein MAM_07269 [Metarhizium album ARSEF 1941]